MGKLAQRLSDAARSGVYRTRQTAEVEDAVRGTRLDLAHVDLGGAGDKEALLERLALALGFPAWFGGNWDALEDCLADLSWLEADGYVLLVEGAAGLPADERGVLEDILASSAAYWAERKRPFFAVFVGGGPQLPELYRQRT